MMTLEQIGQLAVLWYEAEAKHEKARPHNLLSTYEQLMRRKEALQKAIRKYKLLEEAKGK